MNDRSAVTPQSRFFLDAGRIAPALLVALCGSAGGARAGDSDKVLRGCVQHHDNNEIRILSPGQTCMAGETFVEWNKEGPKGDAGKAGPTGPSGAAGPAGATGVAGPMGAAGATGAVGLAGPMGPAGATGVAGPMGIAGATGAAGLAGPMGPAGATGVAGPMGIAGATGAAGPAGPAGPSTPASVLNFVAQFGNGIAVAGQAQPYCILGGVYLTAGSVASGLLADGALLHINTNQALFSLLGTTYGGDGVTTFALPDLRGLAPTGLTYYICDVGVFPARN